MGDDLNPDNSNLDISYQIDVNPVGTFGKTDGAGVPLDTQTQSFTVDNVDSITNYSIPNIQYNNNYEITIQAKNNLNENYGPSETINVVGPELNINYFESGEQLLNLNPLNYPREDIYLMEI